MEAMKVWMEMEVVKYSPSSRIGKVITYACWDNMMCCFEDGRLPIANNLAENKTRIGSHSRTATAAT